MAEGVGKQQLSQYREKLQLNPTENSLWTIYILKQLSEKFHVIPCTRTR
jgi:hypothetical protein